MFFDDEYISEYNGKFKVHKEINGEDITFGIFNNVEDAIKLRDELDYDGWPLILDLQKDVLNEKHIKQDKNGNYIVYHFVNNHEVNFGPYLTLNEAKKAKRNLLSNGWESDKKYSKSKYTKYITKNGNSFTVQRNINSRTKSFGTFSKLEDAIKRRDELVDNSWVNDENDDLEYISTFKGKYVINKSINGEVVHIGTFNTKEEAISVRNEFRDLNWNLTPELRNKYLKKNRYIRKWDKGYSIVKRVDGDLKEFGTFKTLEEATSYRDELEAKNWIVDNSYNGSYDVNEKNIEFDGKYYTIERFVYSKIRIYGVYKNLNYAIKIRDKIIQKGWGKFPYLLKTKKYPYGENLVVEDDKFKVQNVINGKIREFGTFSSFKGALNKINELKNNDWNIKPKKSKVKSSPKKESTNDKISAEDVKKIFLNTTLIEEPKIPFPQLDIFDDLIKVCNLLLEEPLNKAMIMEKCGVKPRHYSFFISAGRYLGVIENGGGGFKFLTSEGKRIMNLDEKYRNLEFVKLILEHKPYYDVFKWYVENKQMPDTDTVFEILSNNYIYNVDSNETLRRRSTSVKSWIKWIANLYPGFIKLDKNTSVDLDKFNNLLSNFDSCASKFTNIFSDSYNKLLEDYNKINTIYNNLNSNNIDENINKIILNDSDIIKGLSIDLDYYFSDLGFFLYDLLNFFNQNDLTSAMKKEVKQRFEKMNYLEKEFSKCSKLLVNFFKLFSNMHHDYYGLKDMIGSCKDFNIKYNRSNELFISVKNRFDSVYY